MSWNLSIIRSQEEEAGLTKYDAIGFRQDSSEGLGPFKFELDKTTILASFKELLPLIINSSNRFRSQTITQEPQEELLSSLAKIGRKLYLALDLNLREAIRTAKRMVP